MYNSNKFNLACINSSSSDCYDPLIPDFFMVRNLNKMNSIDSIVLIACAANTFKSELTKFYKSGVSISMLGRLDVDVYLVHLTRVKHRGWSKSFSGCSSLRYNLFFGIPL